MTRFFSFFLCILAFWAFASVSRAQTTPWWEFQAVDTMKYSRDTSGEYLHKPDVLKKVSEQQVKAIAEVGATHVAIATPYDPEFLPVLKEWVAAARRHNLKVWFRGNWSGWEEWFGHKKITREEHQNLTVAFIKDNATLFEEGDVFSACPECENGGPGDPRHNGDAAGHRAFLISEYQAMNEAFRSIGKNVRTNFNSMNGDVAELIMDPETTKALGGLVVVDHYVRTPQELNDDITELAQQSGGQVILGEFGAPIPDIHGPMTQEQQKAWVGEALDLLAENPALAGLSYWTGVGGSTALWNENMEPRQVVGELRAAFVPLVWSARVTNELNAPLPQAKITSEKNSFNTSKKGDFVLKYRQRHNQVKIEADKHHSVVMSIPDHPQPTTVVLKPTNPSWWYRLRLWLRK